jgi:hypothetical protein
VSQLCLEFCARLAKEFAGSRSRREDCLLYVTKVRRVLDERLGVLVPLKNDSLGLIVVEVDLVLQRGSEHLGRRDLPLSVVAVTLGP